LNIRHIFSGIKKTLAAIVRLASWASKRGGKWALARPWILKIIAQKGCFLSLEWEQKLIPPLLAASRKTFGKIHQCPPGKNPSDVQASRNRSVVKDVVLI